MSLEQRESAEDLGIDADIGRTVHFRMWDRGMTGVTLAAALGVDQSGLSKRLRGERGWSAANLRDAAKALNTTIAYLVGEVGDPDWCTPRDLNPEPTDIGSVTLASVTPIDAAPRFRELVSA